MARAWPPERCSRRASGRRGEHRAEPRAVAPGRPAGAAAAYRSATARWSAPANGSIGRAVLAWRAARARSRAQRSPETRTADRAPNARDCQFRLTIGSSLAPIADAPLVRSRRSATAACTRVRTYMLSCAGRSRPRGCVSVKRPRSRRCSGPRRAPVARAHGLRTEAGDPPGDGQGQLDGDHQPARRGPEQAVRAVGAAPTAAPNPSLIARARRLPASIPRPRHHRARRAGRTHPTAY